MRTTLDLNNQLLRTAKQRAAKEGVSLTSILENALRNYLRPLLPQKGKAYKLKLLVRRAGPGTNIDFSDRDDLFERMEGRR